MEIEIDFSDAEIMLGDMMRRYIATTSKTSEEAINKKMTQLLAVTVKNTPRADQEKIVSYLQTAAIAYKIVNKRLAPGEATKKERIKAAKQMIAAKKRSIGYIKAGWFKALALFSGRAGGKVMEGKSASKGTGKKATAANLLAEATNHSFGAEVVSGPELDAAMEYVAKDIIKYLEDKLGENWASLT